MKIGLVPMSAKPYHEGHHWLVKKAADENDRIIVFVSTSDRKKKGEFPISGKAMIKIWKEELEEIMPENTEIIYGGSPVRHVYSTIGSAANANSDNDPTTINDDDVYSIYSDYTDTLKNYPEKNRNKYMQPLYDEGQVKFPAEEKSQEFTRGGGAPDISGTSMRAFLQEDDFESFKNGLPQGTDAQNIWDILKDQNLSEYLDYGDDQVDDRLLNESDEDLILGTDEYNDFIDEIIQRLKKVKQTLRTRSRKGKENRKEADRIQSAIGSLKHLKNRSLRILNNSNTLNERVVRLVAPPIEEKRVEEKEEFDRESLKEFFRKFR
jgi:cytidyltransferase-like protein